MITWTLLVSLTLKSTLVLALAWLAALGLRRRSAAARHTVWTAAAAALLALPLLSISLPAWPHRFANLVLPAGSTVTFRTTATTTDTPAGPASRVSPSSTRSTSAGATFDSRGLLVLLWAAGAAVAIIQMLFAYVVIWRLRRAARPSALAGAVAIDRAVSIVETPQGMPMTAGILRPVIFMPAESAGWTSDRVRLVLLHELAHIERGDAATQLLARTALCLHWFNPLAWIAWREFIKERERAADDLVLKAGARASDYAGHLLEIARTMQSLPVAAAAGVMMARRSQLEGRLLAILDSHVKRTEPSRAALALAIIAALAVTAPLATVRAQSRAEQQLPADLDVTFRVANAQKNHELLEQTAGTYEKLRKYPEAQQLREAALAIRKESGDRSAKYAEGLVKLGDLAQQRRAFPEAIDYYTRAVAIGDMPETVPALMSLGMDAFRKHDIAAAKDYLQRARNAAKTGNDTGRAMTWLAFISQGDPTNSSEAESLYRAAISIEDPDSAAQALTTEMLARFLRAQDRIGEAEPFEQRATAMRKALAASLSTRYEAAVSSAVKVGNGVTAPKLVAKVEPEYTEQARAIKHQGTVLLKIVVDVDGLAKDMRVINSLGLGLDEKAVEAISRWRFQPGEAGGVPVAVMAQVEVNFRLM